jgi:phasin family protein
MYPFSQSINPAVRNHVDAQTAFINDMSKSMFKSFQQMCDLNIQLMQTMLEETTTASRQMMSADSPTDRLNAAASRAQPASDKLRAYQQHIARVAADAQVDMARVTEQHVQNTSRTARALADEVTRDATEQTERGLRAQQDGIRQYSDPFARPEDGASTPSRMGSGDGRDGDVQGRDGRTQQMPTGAQQQQQQQQQAGQRGTSTH